MGWIPAVVAVVSAVTSGVMQYRQGQNEQILSNWNAANQQRQEGLQAMAMRAQAALEKSSADANFALAKSEADARFANAARIEADVATQDRVDRINLQNRRAEMERAQSEQMAGIAASGVVAVGTPADLAAETASAIQRDLEDNFWAMGNNRISALNEAELERFGGRLGLAGSLTGYRSAVAGAGMTALAGKSRYDVGMREAALTRLAGKQAYSRGLFGALDTAATGVAKGAGSWSTYQSDRGQTFFGNAITK